MNLESEVDHKETNFKCSYLFDKGCGETLMQATVAVKNGDNAVRVVYLFCPVCGLMTFRSCVWLDERGD